MRYLPVIILFFICLSVYGQARDRASDGGRKQERQERQQQRVDKQLRKADNGNNRDNRGNNKGIPNNLMRIKEIKTAYITAKLELTSDQSTKFWPLYGAYQEELFTVQRAIRQNNSPLQPSGKDQIMNKLALDEKKIGIEKHYATEFLKILPYEKVSQIYKSEKEFQDEALKRLKENRKDANN